MIYRKAPKVSVIIPTYNRSHLVGRAIRSVLNQTYQNLEIIVVDDGSTDNTKEVIKSFNDSRIQYIRHEKNKGGSAARNTGIKAAKGEFIAFQDSDDEWLPDKLEKQMNAFKDAPPEVGVVYTGFWRIEHSKRIYIPSLLVKQKEGNIHNELLKGNFVGTPAIVVRKKCFEKVGIFDENLPQLEDWELVIRLSKYYKFLYIDEPLLISYYQSDSITANQRALVKALILILEKHYEDFKRNRKIIAKRQYVIGSVLCQSGEISWGRDYLVQALRSYPLNIKYLVAIFVSLFGKSAYGKVVRLKRRI